MKNHAVYWAIRQAPRDNAFRVINSIHTQEQLLNNNS